MPLIPGATIKQAFQQASSVPFSLIVDDALADNEEGVDLSAEDFVDKLISVSQLFMSERSGPAQRGGASAKADLLSSQSTRQAAK